MLEKNKLTITETRFITSIASDFIDSYSCNGEIRIGLEENPQDIMKEINICKRLLKKLETRG